MLTTALATIAVTLPGVAVGPRSCVAQRVSCREARAVTLAWEDSTADTLSHGIRFRWGGRRWFCRIKFEYGHSFNLAVCTRIDTKRRLVKFALRWPAIYLPDVVCRNSPAFPGVSGGLDGATRGSGCDLTPFKGPVPTADTITHPPGWRCTWWGHSGRATPKPAKPNIATVWCESLPTSTTSLTQAVTASFRSPITGTAMCRPTANGCMWGGLPPDSGSPTPPQEGA
jgi:hypothetical protein